MIGRGAANHSSPLAATTYDRPLKSNWCQKLPRPPALWYYMCSPPRHSHLVPWFPPTSPPSTLHPIEVRLFCPDSVRLSTWCVVVSSWSYSSQLLEIAWVKKSRFIPPIFHQFAKHLLRFILILMYLFCQAIWMIFHRYTRQQPKFFTLPVARRIH